MLDEFEIRRQKLLDQLKGRKKKSAFDVSERPKSVFSPQSEVAPATEEPKGPQIGLFTLEDRVIEFIQKEGHRVARFRVFNKAEQAPPWVEENSPELFVVDIDDPVPESTALDLLAELPLLTKNIKICLLSNTPRGKMVSHLCKMGAQAILKKPIQLLDIKEILKGNIPIDCRPPKV